MNNSIQEEQDTTLNNYLRRLTESSQSKRCSHKGSLKRIRKYDQPYYSRSYKLLTLPQDKQNLQLVSKHSSLKQIKFDEENNKVFEYISKPSVQVATQECCLLM